MARFWSRATLDCLLSNFIKAMHISPLKPALMDHHSLQLNLVLTAVLAPHANHRGSDSLLLGPMHQTVTDTGHLFSCP